MHLKYDFLFQEYDDRYMAIPEYTGKENDLEVLWVNDIGKEIMEILKDDITFDCLVETLKNRYIEEDISIEKCVKEFLDSLEKENFLVK